ncbi:MAG: hypothetical protein K9J17_13740 [Flavobacteriales bacterium]|nr:hypothetical protein [Flavobacteriales bacterium]
MTKSKYILGYAMMALFISGCEGCEDDEISACECEAEAYIDQSAIVSTQGAVGSINNYDQDGDFTADAACHALMFIYFEWEDSARARTTEVPSIIPSFETPLGYFPSSDLRTKETILRFDEDLGEYIIHYSYSYYASGALDKNHPEGTSYTVRWIYGESSAPAGNIKVRATLSNRVYDPNEYSRTNKSECAN